MTIIVSDYSLEAANLQTFLNLAKPLLASVCKKQPELQNATKLKNVLEQLNKPLAKARSDGAFINPWITAGLRRYEVRNSAVLAELWRPLMGGQTARTFLLNFLSRLKVPDGVLLPKIGENCSYSVSCEQCPMGDQKDRIDLLIEGANFLIGIEIKIDAPEGKGQLEKYLEVLQKRAKDSEKSSCHLIFLANVKPLCVENVIHATWQDVKKAARQTLPVKRCDWSFNHHLIEQFAQHISNF